MKASRLLLILLVAVLAGGCVWHRSAKSAKPQKKPVAPAIVTPDNSLSAKVISYNSVGRFVVLSYPAGQVPKMDRLVSLYRNGLKVAEARITGPQSDNNIVADLITGDAQVGDEVRDE